MSKQQLLKKEEARNEISHRSYEYIYLLSVKKVVKMRIESYPDDFSLVSFTSLQLVVQLNLISNLLTEIYGVLEKSLNRNLHTLHCSRIKKLFEFLIWSDGE